MLQGSQVAFLGRGRYGAVWKVNLHVAVKVTNPSQGMNEVAAMKQVGQCEEIIQFHGFAAIQDKVYIYMQLCAGSLEGRTFPEDHAALQVRQIFQGLPHEVGAGRLWRPGAFSATGWHTGLVSARDPGRWTSLARLWRLLAGSMPPALSDLVTCKIKAVEQWPRCVFSRTTVAMLQVALAFGFSICRTSASI